MTSRESDTSIQHSPPPTGGTQEFVSQLIRTFPSDRTFSAREIVNSFPHLADHRSCLIDLAYEEFCRLRDAGAKVTPTEFAGRYRDIEQSLHRVIEFDQIIHQHPEVIESVPDDHWPVAGDSFCGMQLIEQIGRGVLSRVFLAKQERLGNRRAVAKVCARGEQEASLLGKLSHPAIATVYSIDSDSQTGLSVICMPYLTRATLHHVTEVLRTSDLTGKTAADVAQTIRKINADDSYLDKDSGEATEMISWPFARLILHWGERLSYALQTAHSTGILHCDVKPGNVLVLSDLSVQLLDFNLASTTTGGERILGGTMPYMASEQLQLIIDSGSRPSEGDDETNSHDQGASAATDVYGLCATLWHSLTGSPPFGVGLDGDRVGGAKNILAQQLIGADIDHALASHPEVPREVFELLADGLHANPAARPASANELARRFASLQVQLYQTSPREKSPLRRTVLLTSLALAAALALVVFAYSFSNRATEPGWRKAARQSLQSGRLVEFQESLQRQLASHPEDADLAFELCLSYLHQQEFRRARSLISQLMTDDGTSSSHAGIRFCQAYLTSLEFEPPASGYVSGNSTSKERHDVLLMKSDQLLDAWREVATTGNREISSLALFNGAVIATECGDYPTARSLLSQLPEDFDVPGFQRVQSTLNVLEGSSTELPDQGDCIRFKSYPTSQLSEAQTLAALVCLLSVNGSATVREVDRFLSNVAPVHISRPRLRQTLLRKSVSGNPSLVNVILKHSQRDEPPVNFLVHTLGLPNSEF
ncbi:MAG: serine/threonine protein kinase [Planctomycetaceae bacterium]|nr:serine/threonine protein kinase [Planctomycetaceae bacterium]